MRDPTNGPRTGDFGPYRRAWRAWSDGHCPLTNFDIQETSLTTLPVRRHHPRSLFPEFSELFAGFPALAGLRPAFDTRVMRLEDEMKDGRYVVRAEMPGIDPAKDIDITVRDGQLTIKAERSEKKDFDGRSEFSSRLIPSHRVTAGRR